jgi:hypothetical protein
LALTAREIDMRASPYDLSAFGCDPIAVETEAGSERYEREQRALSDEARPLRQRAIVSLENVLAAAERADHTRADAAHSPSS